MLVFVQLGFQLSDRSLSKSAVHLHGSAAGRLLKPGTTDDALPPVIYSITVSLNKLINLCFMIFLSIAFDTIEPNIRSSKFKLHASKNPYQSGNSLSRLITLNLRKDI